jgi:uncharacterized membrane protein
MLNIYKNLVRPEENVLTVSYNLLKILKVKVTRASIKKVLEQHPHYPSLLSVTDLLNHYRVENITVKLNLDRIKLLRQPFLALLKWKDAYTEYYCLIKSVFETGVLLLNSNTGRSEKYTWDEFEKLFQGIVLIAERDDLSGEKNYEIERRKELKNVLTTNLLLLFAPCLTIFVGIYSFNTAGFDKNILPFIYSLLSLLGIGTSSLLFWFEIDSSNKALLEVCGGENNNNSLNCGAVLKSKRSSFFGVSWSVWGTTFFLSLLFGQLLNGFSNTDTLQYLTIFSILTAFYIPFSIYYQWKVVKQWCRLCLTIQFILFSQFLIAVLSSSFNSTFLFSSPGLSWHGVGIFAGIGILCFLLSNQILNLLHNAKSDKTKLNESMRVKFDPLVFDSTLKRQKAISISTEGLGILLGNPNSKNKIVKVCNPYCAPCAKMHPVLDDLLEDIGDLSVQILFTASTDHKDERAKPVKHLLAIYEANNEELTKDSLADWYNAPEKNYDLFAEKYKIDGDLSKQTEKVDKMHDWCKKMNIEFTPTIFFNGYQLPETYNITDLEYFLKS